MLDHQDACRALSVPMLAREVLHGSLTDGINAAVECCDRWAGDPGQIALNWIGKDFAEETVTFVELREQSCRFANLLRAGYRSGRCCWRPSATHSRTARGSYRCVARGCDLPAAVYCLRSISDSEPRHIYWRQSGEAYRD